MRGGRGRARAISDAFRRRVPARRRPRAAAEPACFCHALMGPTRPARRAAHVGQDTTDTGAYIVTGFINLAEQRRTCARAMISSSALLAAQCYLPASPAQRFCCPARPLPFLLKTQNCSPIVLTRSYVRRSLNWAPWHCRPRGQTQWSGSMRALSRRRGCLQRSGPFLRENPALASVLQAASSHQSKSR